MARQKGRFRCAGESMNSSQNVKSRKNIFIPLILILCAAVILVIVGFLGFRDGGWFRSRGDDLGLQNMQSLEDYAKQLEENGSSEAAAAVYELIARNGGGELIRRANEEIPVVKANNGLEQFSRFMSGEGAGDGR